MTQSLNSSAIDLIRRGLLVLVLSLSTGGDAGAIVTGPSTPQIESLNGRNLVAPWGGTSVAVSTGDGSPPDFIQIPTGNAIPISPRHLLTVKHIYPVANPTNLVWSFSVDGQSFVSSYYQPHPVRDLAIITIDGVNDLPGYFRLKRARLQLGEAIVVAGHGRRSAGALSSGAGVLIETNPTQVYPALYAPNVISSVGPGTFAFGFSSSTGGASLYDSGGGVFQQVGADFQLAGLITSTISSGSYPPECSSSPSGSAGRCALFGNHTTFGISFSSMPVLRWIKEHVPGAQICVSDFDGNGQKSIQDVMSYLEAWFARDLSAKFLDDYRAVSQEDLFRFLESWFGEEC